LTANGETVSGPANPLAVVLRGPMSVGKTEVAKRILQATGSSVEGPIVLDDGWAWGGRRYVGGQARYEDLQGLADHVIVLELGWGEPKGEGFPGATRNPEEWAEILMNEGRELRLFRLTARRADVVRRARRRWAEQGHWATARDARRWIAWYERHPDVVGLPKRLGTAEIVVDTTRRTPELVAEVILAKLRG